MKFYRKVPLDLALSSLSFDPEAGLLRWKERPRDQFKSDGAWRAANTRYAGKVAGHPHTCTVGKTYIQVRLGGMLYYAHRIIWTILNGPIPEGAEIDHEDGDGTNNRLSNMNLVTDTFNKRNMRLFCTNKTGRVGVYLDGRRGRWNAAGWKDGAKVHLGSFDVFEQAVEARAAFEVEQKYHTNHGTERPL